MNNDNVVLVEEYSLPESIQGLTAIFPCDFEEIDEFVYPMHLCCRSHQTIEQDDYFKQLIAAVIVCKGDKVLTFKPLAGEGNPRTFLAGKHIQANDYEALEIQQTVIKGVYRICREDLGISDCYPIFLGIINEEESIEGKHHLGFVFLVELEEGETMEPDSAFAEMEWISLNELEKNIHQYDVWSKITFPEINYAF